MGPKGFMVEYKVVDKMPIGVIYILIMHYHEYSAHRDVLLTSMYVPQEVVTNLKELLHEILEQSLTNSINFNLVMNMNNIVQVFKNVVDDFNLVDGQNRGLHLDYHIFSGVINTAVYNLEITILATQEKVSLSRYILPEDDPKSQILRTLELLIGRLIPLMMSGIVHQW